MRNYNHNTNMTLTFTAFDKKNNNGLPNHRSATSIYSPSLCYYSTSMLYEMKWIILSAIIATLICVNFINVQKFTNNVCKTFEDYYSDRDSNENCYHNPDHELLVPDIIQSHGYPVEIHHATTVDGYILTIFRIPYGRNSSSKKLSKPVFLQHGLASSSSCFISTGQKSLGFILADQGYDVWMGNFRGSIYSRHHIHLKDSDNKYWNFSFHEYGIYDLPAQLDLVGNLTNEKITYIGFSMGTMAMYIYSVTYPEISFERINVFINLAPSAFLGDLNTVIKPLLSYWHIIEPVIQTLTNGKLFARLSIPAALLKIICFPYPFQMKFCQLPDMIAFGFNYEQSDPETLPVTYLQNADWTSVKAFTHLTQLVLSRNFQYFDYGDETNRKVYGLPAPPHYNLTKIEIPTYFIRANNDLVVTKENVERLYNSLPKTAKPYDIYVIKNENFNHLDFVTAKDVVPLLYDHVVDFIRTNY